MNLYLFTGLHACGVLALSQPLSTESAFFNHTLAPGGIIVVGTEIGRQHTWTGGGYFYTEETLFDRLIIPSKCQLIGDYDFSFYDEEKASYLNEEYNSMIMFLKKG